jgi:hypothetical protein
MILLTLVKAVVAWLIMMLIGTNLIGLVVRGAHGAFLLLRRDSGTPELVAPMARRHGAVSAVLTVVWVILTVTYLFVLVRFWNSWLAVAGIMLMASRLPDLLREIRTGSRAGFRGMPRGPVYTLATIMSWAALPLVWYALHVGKR